jgi:hypothetical protein
MLELFPAQSITRRQLRQRFGKLRPLVRPALGTTVLLSAPMVPSSSESPSSIMIPFSTATGLANGSLPSPRAVLLQMGFGSVPAFSMDRFRADKVTMSGDYLGAVHGEEPPRVRVSGGIAQEAPVLPLAVTAAAAAV